MGTAATAPSGNGGSAARAPSLPPPLARPTKATLILDFTPNAVHAGIYRALAAGYYRRENIELQVVAPSATVEPLSLVSAGRAQFGLADGSDVATAIDHGAGDEAVMALVQRPVGGLIALASEHLRSPAQLQGRTVGITGVPSDLAVLDTEVRHAGGDPAKVHVVTVGFNGAQALLAGRVAAFTGFIPDDGVGLEVEGHPIMPFWLDRNGGPEYPGLVAFATPPARSMSCCAPTPRCRAPSHPPRCAPTCRCSMPAASRSGGSSRRTSPNCRAGCSPATSARRRSRSRATAATPSCPRGNRHPGPLPWSPVGPSRPTRPMVTRRALPAS